jgi:hypothetical protein
MVRVVRQIYEAHRVRNTLASGLESVKERVVRGNRTLSHECGAARIEKVELYESGSHTRLPSCCSSGRTRANECLCLSTLSCWSRSRLHSNSILRPAGKCQLRVLDILLNVAYFIGDNQRTGDLPIHKNCPENELFHSPE